MATYRPQDIEPRWQKEWTNWKNSGRNIYEVNTDPTRPKYYVLDMFPYPSGAGLHVGHPLGYIASDIYARYKRHNGFNVLHPMGYDAFGLPAEQYAIETGQHPAITTEANIKRYKEQLDKIGFSFDWSRQVKTCDPDYYRWTQWIFGLLFQSWYDPRKQKARPIQELVAHFEKEGYTGCEPEKLTGDIEESISPFTAAQWNNFSEAEQENILQQFRLAYQSETYVNWCPALGTVLANEEVKDGVSERGGYPVERKLMQQWSLRITAYADRLLQGLDTIDWSESIKESQRNWIGKSQGAAIYFQSTDKSFEIEVFSTRPDTIFGATFLVIAPEHELVSQITTSEHRKEVDAYVHYASTRSERDRMAEVKKITGAFTGAYVKHPFTGRQLPVWIGDYVLAGYGTGAVMAVPAHDTRDHAFARHFGLPINQVVTAKGVEIDIQQESYDAKDGYLINSEFLNGLSVSQAIPTAIHQLEEKGAGKGKTNYRLRDAIFSRQRYWGEPIPIYYKDGVPQLWTEALTLPEVDKFLPTESGEPPLARAKNFHTPEGHPFETSTMPGWAGSSWYFFRYMDPKNSKAFADREALNYWQNVDLYIGGSEHATGHLLYARFWTKFLYDLELVPVDEPFKKLINQGMIGGISVKAYVSNSADKSLPKGFYQQDDGFKDYIFYSGYPVRPSLNYNTFIEKKPGLIELNFLGAPTNFPIEVADFNSVKVIEGKEIVPVNLLKAFQIRESVFKNTLFRCTNGLFLNGRFILYDSIEKLIKSRDPKSEKANVLFNNDEFNDNPELAEFWCYLEQEKMSKSKYNVVNPDDIVAEYGADTLRMYEMFLGPLELSKPWNTNGIEGVSRFLNKFWRLFHNREDQFQLSEEAPTQEELKVLHKTIKKIREDIESFSFNTAVSAFMVCTNELGALKCNKRAILEPLCVLISPFAPHIAEELWSLLGHSGTVCEASYPVFDPALLVENAFNYPISVNGKVRANLELPLDSPEEDVKNAALALESIQKFTEGKPLKKFIFVKGRIINLVV